MATHRIPILGANTTPDSSGFVFFDQVANQLSLANSKPTIVLVMQDPNGGGDSGIHGKFNVPENFVGTPELVIEYIIDGTPANAVAFGMQCLALTDSEAFDAAYGTQDIASNSTWTGYADEDLVEEVISLANLSAAAGDEVFFFFFIDDSVHTFTGNVLVTGLYFQYADA